MKLAYEPQKHIQTRYIFFTGKGGVGKTSTACATAVTLADAGKKVLLVSTDPASNLQDIFERPLSSEGLAITDVPGLVVANLDPIEAAYIYKEKVVSPYRGKLPESVIKSMEEQLSGSCTVEIAAFNAFSELMTDVAIAEKYDHIVFDTAPTGHTLRMLQLPSAWHTFIDENKTGASCLGQLSGLEDKKDMYGKAVETLKNEDLTTLILVTRPEKSPVKEAARASKELQAIGVNNQVLIINGLLGVADDDISHAVQNRQKDALENSPFELSKIEKFNIPLRSYNVVGLKAIREFLLSDDVSVGRDDHVFAAPHNLELLIDSMYESNKKVVFTMGKGGVGKTTIAAEIAKGLSNRGKRVHLTTTDPAAHLSHVIGDDEAITISYIDESKALENYRQDVLEQARGNVSKEDLAYIEEDLKSPCTQEIAVFRAFAAVIDDADHDVVVVDTAPTGHTLLLLDSTQSYHQEIERSHGLVPDSVRKLLPRLRNSKETEVVILTLAEATPFYEAKRLEEDLKRAGIHTNWWVINASMYVTSTRNALLKAKALNEREWIQKIDAHVDGKFVLVPWKI